MNTKYQGRCFCGAVQFQLTGSPEAMAYCHCNSCRHWAAGPISAFTLWKPSAFEVTQGLDCIDAFDKNSSQSGGEVLSNRKWCKSCGGHIFTDHPTMGLIDVPAAVIDNFAFKPGFHVHYQETVLPIKDGLPKFSDLPKEAGGSGEQLAE